MAKTQLRKLRDDIISDIEKALREKRTNVALRDSPDRKLVYDVAEHFRAKPAEYHVRVGPHNEGYTLIVERL